MTEFYVDGSIGKDGVPKDASDLWFWEDVLNDKPGPLDDIIPIDDSKELSFIPMIVRIVVDG